MSQENEEVVRSFIADWAPNLDAMKKSYRDHLTEDVYWESVGSTPHEGLEEAIRHLDELREQNGMEYCTADILHIASDGDVVLTERVDRMHRADGSVLADFRIMGAFELRDGRICRYSDYLDMARAAQVLGRA